MAIERTQGFVYVREDDGAYTVSAGGAANLVIPKARALPEPPLGAPSSPLTPAFRLLFAAFLGLAPAGLGTLVLAPLAALWALVILATRRTARADRIRALMVWLIAAGLLGIAIPMYRLFQTRISG